jgi:hypothetical protein
MVASLSSDLKPVAWYLVPLACRVLLRQGQRIEEAIDEEIDGQTIWAVLHNCFFTAHGARHAGRTSDCTRPILLPGLGGDDSPYTLQAEGMEAG